MNHPETPPADTDGPTPSERAARAARALRAYAADPTGHAPSPAALPDPAYDDIEANLRDLLTDLQHWADRTGISFDAAAEAAVICYREEVARPITVDHVARLVTDDPVKEGLAVDFTHAVTIPIKSVHAVVEATTDLGDPVWIWTDPRSGAHSARVYSATGLRGYTFWHGALFWDGDTPTKCDTLPGARAAVYRLLDHLITNVYPQDTRR